ncbi:SWPV1-035 [Shearwaterpox virus]|uniref:SWPV1-035 n=1 Tax=Shearwaterpox virus TaxID=1974596 RepID=A0A1V0S7Q1_CNPV|nr:SWPV1-035 [Shearwaterpox virus]
MSGYNTTVNNINYTINSYSRIILACMYVIIFMVGIIGNIKLIRLIMAYKNISILPFLNLGIADLLFVMFIPLYVVYILSNFRWYFGKTLCKISSFFFTSNMFASIFLITLINVYRYVKIILPSFTYKYITFRNVCLAVVFTWIFSIMLGMPALYFRDTIVLKDNDTLCINRYSNNKATAEFIYKIVICIRFTLGYLFPMIIIIICNILLIYKSNNTSVIYSKIFFISLSASIVFFICWTPHHIINIITLIDNNNKNLRRFIKEASPVFAGFGCLYSAINPIIYIMVVKLLGSYEDDPYNSLIETLIDENEPVCTTEDTNVYNDIEINDIIE